MAWRSFTATGTFASIFGLVLLVSSGCSGDGSALFAPVGGSSGLGASGGDTASGGGKSNSAGSTSSGAGTSNSSGGAGNQAGTDTGGTDAGGMDAGGMDTGGTDTGGTDTGGTDTGGMAGSTQGGHAGSMAGMGGSGGKGGGGGGGGGSGGGPATCTTALFGGHSYSFCGAVDSGNAAFELCEKLGMVLVSIESKAENDFLVGELAGSSWIGGSDEGHEGEWHWPSEVVFWDESGDGKGPIQGRYQNWQEGQPNNDNDDGLDENCAIIQMSAATEGTWNDLACGMDTDFRATCESTGPVIGPIPL